MTERPLQARNALDMVRRRARDAGIAVPGLCNHSLRATGITTYIAAGGALETAQAIAGHAQARERLNSTTAQGTRSRSMRSNGSSCSLCCLVP